MNDLVLGWALNAGMAPAYWSPGAKPGKHTPAHLITSRAKDMAYHSVIVAQSGSGKSYFLGRLLEELILKTRGRVIVLDPNADFRRICDVVPASWWTSAEYDADRCRGRLPDEESRDLFEPIWKRMDLKVLSGPYSTPHNTDRLRVSWNTFPIAFLAEDLDAMARSQVYHCHEFVKSIAILEMEKLRRQSPAVRMERSNRLSGFEKTRRLLQRARHEGPKEVLEEEFPSTTSRGALSFIFKWRRTRLSQARERAASAVEFVSPDIERFYFGRAKEYVAEDIVSNTLSEEPSGLLGHKGCVVDLPSFRDSRTQQVVLSSVVETIWNHARQEWAIAFEKETDKDERVPTFIVVEEAHNIVPENAYSFSAEALREQFRTIAAEGRKYGVFLILCTQRPDKIDSTLISECENRAVMKIGTKGVLEKTKELLGLEWIPEYQLNKCLEFQTGRFLIVGPWSGETAKLGYSAMRRTVEGGRNLREDHWAVPEPPPVVNQTPSNTGETKQSESGEIKEIVAAEPKRKNQ